MEGYAKVAFRMATQPELAIFRRFKALNAQNLLYMQAELTYLEAQLRRKAEEDARADDERSKLYSRDWYTLSAVDAEGAMNEQWRLMTIISDKLEQYNRNMYHQAQLYRTVTPPAAHNVAIIKSLLEDPRLPDYFLGQDESTWRDPALAHDLAAIAPVHSFTPLTAFLVQLFLAPYHRIIGRRRRTECASGAPNADADLYYYHDSRLEMPAYVASTVLASVLPVAAIAVLYAVGPDMPKRLGIIAAFTAAFSFSLALLTRAKMSDIAAATAAFAAVQVVFVGTNGPASS